MATMGSEPGIIRVGVMGSAGFTDQMTTRQSVSSRLGVGVWVWPEVPSLVGVALGPAVGVAVGPAVGVAVGLAVGVSVALAPASTHAATATR
jgi:hypothetical protein